MDARTAKRRRNWILLGLLVLVGAFVWQIRAVVNPLLLGYGLAFVLTPAVHGLERRGLSHRASVVAVFALATVGSAVLALALFVQTQALVGDLLTPRDVATAPDETAPDEPTPDETTPDAAAGGANFDAEHPIERRIESALVRLDGWLGGGVLPTDVPPVREFFSRLRFPDDEESERLQAVGAAGLDAAGEVLGFVEALLTRAFGLATLAVLVPIYAFYLLFEIPSIHSGVVGWVPVRRRERFVRVTTRIGEVLSAYLRGRLVVCLLKGALLAVGLLLAGVPYWLLLGFLGGFLSVIPYIGGLVAFLLAAVVALADHQLLPALVRTGIVFAVAELVEGYVLLPRIIGRDLGLSDVAVLFAITAFGAAFGLFGVLLALPLAAAVKILFVELVEPALEEWAEEDDAERVLRSD